MILLLALARLVSRTRARAVRAPRPPALDRRRRGSCAYRADAYGDRLEGYDGARRLAWVERLERVQAL